MLPLDLPVAEALPALTAALRAKHARDRLAVIGVSGGDNASLVAEVFPGVPIKGRLSNNGTLLSIEKARRLLDYHPQFSWKTHV